MKAELAAKASDSTQVFQISENVVYLMGISFILGSLFTIFVLILLDFMRRDRIAN